MAEQLIQLTCLMRCEALHPHPALPPTAHIPTHTASAQHCSLLEAAVTGRHWLRGRIEATPLPILTGTKVGDQRSGAWTRINNNNEKKKVAADLVSFYFAKQKKRAHWINCKKIEIQAIHWLSLSKPKKKQNKTRVGRNWRNVENLALTVKLWKIKKTHRPAVGNSGLQKWIHDDTILKTSEASWGKYSLISLEWVKTDCGVEFWQLELIFFFFLVKYFNPKKSCNMWQQKPGSRLGQTGYRDEEPVGVNDDDYRALKQWRRERKRVHDDATDEAFIFRVVGLLKKKQKKKTVWSWKVPNTSQRVCTEVKEANPVKKHSTENNANPDM